MRIMESMSNSTVDGVIGVYFYCYRSFLLLQKLSIPNSFLRRGFWREYRMGVLPEECYLVVWTHEEGESSSYFHYNIFETISILERTKYTFSINLKIQKLEQV